MKTPNFLHILCLTLLSPTLVLADETTTVLDKIPGENMMVIEDSAKAINTVTHGFNSLCVTIATTGKLS
jgi:ABC-type dipeptide/oligopeptide/nickel transport system ATPase component